MDVGGLQEGSENPRRGAEGTEENSEQIWIRFDSKSRAWEVNQQGSSEETEARRKEANCVRDVRRCA